MSCNQDELTYIFWVENHEAKDQYIEAIHLWHVLTVPDKVFSFVAQEQSFPEDEISRFPEHIKAVQVRYFGNVTVDIGDKARGIVWVPCINRVELKAEGEIPKHIELIISLTFSNS